MKKIVIMTGLMALLAACGGNTMQDVSNIEEGDGPVLDVSTDAGKSNAEAIIKTVIQEIGIVLKNFKVSASDASGELAKICGRDDYSKSFDATIEGKTGGEVKLTGTAAINKVADDQVGVTENYAAVFNNYGFDAFFATGTTDVNKASAIQSGFKEICAGYDDPSIEMDILQHSYGSLSISGSTGAAIVFDITSSLNIAPEAGDTKINTQGDISFKSGGEILNCPMNFSATIEQLLENPQLFEINCE
jgi:hypothetical protein